MMQRLKTRKQGEYEYDAGNDLLIFRTKERDYHSSLEFDDFVLDMDTKRHITGMRIFDASKVFDISKRALSDLRNLEFGSKMEGNSISISMRFDVKKKGVLERHVQNFYRSVDNSLKDSEVESGVV